VRTRYLSILKNQKGLEEYNCGAEQSENMYVFELPEAEFDVLYTLGVFDAINKECGLLIDDYESETITKKDFDKCMSIINHIPNFPRTGIFYKAFQLAKEKGISVEMDF
jgi:hypothetical protein